MTIRNNFYIPAPYVVVIDENGLSLGTMPAGKAKETATNRGLYLVETDGKANPPVYTLSRSFRIERRKDAVPDGVTSQTVRLLAEDRSMIGIVPVDEARKLASDRGLGLIVLNGSQDPNICMIGDVKKYEYDKKKAEKENAKKQKAVAKSSEQKEIAYPSDTSDSSKGDRTRLLGRAAEFMDSGHPVKFAVKFRGRQMTHANEVMDRIVEEIVATLQNCNVGRVTSAGNVFSIVCTPVKKK